MSISPKIKKYLLYSGLIGLGWMMMVSMAVAVEPDAGFETLYGRLLANYWRPAVTIHGIRTTVFDYQQMATDAAAPDALFHKTREALAAVDPGVFTNDNSAKVFWINAYNFGAIQMIVEHYPVDSIRSIKISLLKHPWSREVVVINGRRYSLSEIEKDILLEKYRDPRIIFAVSCAAVSCPDRTAEPFLAERIDEQLDDTLRTFFSNPKKGALLDKTRGVLTLSWIIDKDSHLFVEQVGGILGFVLPYLGTEDQKWLQQNTVKLRYFKHDWTLNDLAQADGR